MGSIAAVNPSSFCRRASPVLLCRLGHRGRTSPFPHQGRGRPLFPHPPFRKSSSFSINCWFHAEKWCPRVFGAMKITTWELAMTAAMMVGLGLAPLSAGSSPISSRRGLQIESAPICHEFGRDTYIEAFWLNPPEDWKDQYAVAALQSDLRSEYPQWGSSVQIDRSRGSVRAGTFGGCDTWLPYR
jgi:hypothetical protein